MKETLIGITALILIPLAYLLMPFEWRRHKDIQLGNQLVAKIESYEKTHKKLPENNDEAVFKALDFRHDKQFGWQPNYRRTEQGFELSYENGYAKPFLTWNAKDRRWYLKD
ncbi:hypothetical protein [Alysiella filiformis]|uniref:General secretion pathway protein G n=1 Tax=Alysiella filiformis DSM 16848 TaxID=1120981 RepID=A0A286E1X0_9NEIS|nr:hypothetical protein [Alysiella filiformis]QMT30805.1 hypothetical protein H3L97_08660 [Alysiella filiformis]UBQ56213.1 hypothetical protein JF568_00025 [Alysiella filiformis DSM 16848]SOD64882.1 hypothetical protein SAMN02746062_00081 [Alysiella filiformis DSM 16848]